MGTLAVPFTLDAAGSARVLTSVDDHVLIHVVEEIEECRDMDHLCDLDSSWNALHPGITNGDPAADDSGFPMSHVVLSGCRSMRVATTSSAASPRSRFPRSRRPPRPQRPDRPGRTGRVLPLGTRTLDADDLQLAVRAQPQQEPAIPVGTGGERRGCPRRQLPKAPRSRWAVLPCHV
ncbi:DUF1877 family protein [Streptomyces sp. NPDC058864]